ncbi:homodimeric dihydroxyacetone kinase [Tamaricihabitans halophyticus]|uniref:Homodimeric dihydroxyacetone kinase n=1 Tax=Tamaricihabitans halophyticus TaxID=1262583 RepID=A0A4R2R5R1_9PSEU|nr:dihydroxyacetone kinase family protein [Tamaricihabitans halophyticus]TCP57118.1 homodimeric dihydroxyacetone kinase [Tamaricihabitans halophyticus]
MTRVFDDPANYTEDMVTGFVAANQDYVHQVPGGVVRASRPDTPKVAVLTGGGSGHYPAFCGVVGPGFADGAVIGNIFTSPSAEQAYSVGVSAESGAGVVYLFGNYAGDVMNFGLAAQRLTEEGIPARTFAVTDDVASAPVAESSKRRGIAGDFVVFKTACAAAEEGASLDEVLRICAYTNDRTRSLGVAFAGCTMPGAHDPLFTVPERKMGLGLGIHGEPGIAERDMPSASELARTLVDGVLAETPEGAGNRVAVILNGLGATKYEELFVLWGKISRLLTEAGLDVVQPDVGELVTSLDMAGCSLTVTWLDAELERLWQAPVDTPAYRKGAVRQDQLGTGARQNGHKTENRPAAGNRNAVPASGGAVEVSRWVAWALRSARDVLHERAAELGKLDAIAGDGDHGRGMCKGVDAALAAAERAESAAPAALLAAAGDAWAAEAGGTSGALWGAGLRAVGQSLPNDRAPSAVELADGVRATLTAVTSLGKAELGDKTLVDALQPFCHAFEREVAAGKAIAASAAIAVAEASAAAERTAELRPKVGRARPLAERSVGTPDPGAISLSLVLRAIASGE